MNASKLSVIVTTYDRDDLLRRNLFGYLRQTAPHLIQELIVIDDGSACQAANERIVRDVAPFARFPLRYLFQANAGPAKARNHAIGTAHGTLVLITGDDIVPHPDLVRQHWLAHRGRGFEPNVAVLGRITWPEDIRVTPFMEYINEMGLQFGFSIIQDVNDVGFNFFYTSNISLHRAMLDRDALFDTEFPYAVWEDIELAYRLSKLGLRIVYNEFAIGRHYHNISLESFRHRQEKCGYAASIFFNKHPELRDFLGIDAAQHPERETFLQKIRMSLLENYCITMDKMALPCATDKYETVMRARYNRGIRRYMQENCLCSTELGD